MKKNRLFLWTLLLALMVGTSACSDDDNIPENTTENETIKPNEQTDNKVLSLNKDGARNLYRLLKKVDVKTQCAKLSQSIYITESEYQDIKSFTDKLTAGSKNETNKYKRIFSWVVNHVEYENGYSADPYQVFKQKKAVCQGYANLTCTMLHTQGIATVSVNGYLQEDAAHAWLYCYADGKWIVSDPTNGHSIEAKEVQKYDKLLTPIMADVFFEQDGFVCNFFDNRFNLCTVPNKSSVTIPSDICGIKLTAFVPDRKLPDAVTVINIGNDIVHLGNKDLYENNVQLAKQGNNLQKLIIGENNPGLEEYGGAIYRTTAKDSDVPYYIPNGVEEIKLKPMETMEKNTIYDLPNLTKVTIAKGTKIVKGWAIELTPNLKEVYIPKGLEYPENAFPDHAKVIEY